ncbi:type IV pilus assembly protein PilM [bacterium]|nr:MAG: type IV pilus assembly protein PilM [bacterium]
MKIIRFISDFFMDIGNFFKRRSVLGVDIGTTSIKIAEISNKGERLNLENYGILETKEYLNYPSRIIQSSSLKISEKDTAETLKTLLREMRTKSKIAVASIPAFAVFTTILEMPVMSDIETKKAVDFQAPQNIPLPMNEVALDWIKVGEFETPDRRRYQRIFLIGIPQEIIQKYKTIFKNAGLKLIALEIDGLSAIRALLEEKTKTTLLVDLGSETSNIFLMSDGNLFYAGQTDYGGIYLTQAIAHSLGISVMRAEELKRRRGLLTGGAESELSTLTEPFLDVIIQEVNHAKGTYEQRYGKKVDQAMLIGGGANLLGIEKYFADQITTPIVHPNIFRKVTYEVKLEPILGQLNNEFPIAIGLAERYFVQ